MSAELTTSEGAPACRDLNRWLVMALIGVLAASMFGLNWDIDEGVISLFTDQFQKTGDLRYLFQHHNARFSFSWPYFYLLAFFRGNALDPDTYFLLRLPSLILCTLSLLAVNACLRALVPSRTVRLLALVFFVTVTLQLGATRGRYDSPYLFGASIALLSLARLAQGRSWLWVCPGFLAAAFAGTTHPVGLGSIGFMAVVVAYYLYVRPPTKREAVIIALVAGVSAALFLAGLSMGRMPGEFLADLSGVQDQYHTYRSTTFWEERGRYAVIVEQWGLLGKAFVGCVLAGLFWPALGEQRSAVRCCRFGFWLLVLFLAFIPTKWIYYVGLLLPGATVLAAYHFANLWELRLLPTRRGWLSANAGLQWRGMRLSQIIALGLTVCLAVALGRNLYWSARTNSLLARLLRPNGKQSAQCGQLAELVAGKSINLYSDLTVLPLLGGADFDRHRDWQPDVGLGEEIDLSDSGEYLIVSERHRGGTYGYVERHSQFREYQPEKVMDVALFNDTFTIYRMPKQRAVAMQEEPERATAGLGTDARLQ
ncbi:MAG TPA: hypothetical protein VFI31_29525 [Pirellulales bacterium]|nr:hypothetical protein [Pirellulales bacterium]